jgi:transposase
VRAFAALGGVPAVLVPDNLKAAVVRAAFGMSETVTLNRSYRELARPYGFQVDLGDGPDCRMRTSSL